MRHCLYLKYKMKQDDRQDGVMKSSRYLQSQLILGPSHKYGLMQGTDSSRGKCETHTQFSSENLKRKGSSGRRTSTCRW
jgi:hypothetical protein